MTINEQNNKIYWQNHDDGEYLYCIEIPQGNYTSTELEDIMTQTFYDTPRINYEHDVLLNDIISYTNHNNIAIDINTSNNIVTFTSHVKSYAVNPLINTNPIINTDPEQDPSVPITNYKISIEHKNHNLLVGDKITISDAISHMGIPDTIINSEHTIYEIASEHIYTIELPPFNLNSERTNTHGGAAVIINSPNSIKLYFDKSDTLGSVLGFRNVGESYSITNYSHTISNTDSYNIDISYDVVGNEKPITNNILSFNNDSYITMCCYQFNNMYSTGTINNMFAKILLNSSSDKILFNTFVSSPITFFDPIDELYELNLSFYSPNGELFDFNYINHSFTLEITSINEHPKNTNIHNKTGKSYYG
jgi:hypothetical protein